MRLGFVGCGTIAAAIVTGLQSAGNGDSVILSPRNAEVAAGLAARFANVQVAATNQAVLDACDVAVLAVRPQIAASVLPQLRFRADHHVLSLIAAVPLQYLKSAVAPVASVTRAVPLPSVAYRQGPTAIYPAQSSVRALFDALGTVVALDDETEFDTFAAVTAIMASYFSFADTVAGWMTHKGVAPANTHIYVAQILKGLAQAPMMAPDRSFAALAEEHQTAGGLNEQVVRQLTDKGIFAELSSALDAVLTRLRAAHSGRAS